MRPAGGGNCAEEQLGDLAGKQGGPLLAEIAFMALMRAIDPTIHAHKPQGARFVIARLLGKPSVACDRWRCGKFAGTRAFAICHNTCCSCSATTAFRVTSRA